MPKKTGAWRAGRALALAPWGWLAVALILTLTWLTAAVRVPPLVGFYCILTLLASGACGVAYWIDKRAAQKGRRRISERTLHILAAAGGWPAALLSRRIFRHKTKKFGFTVQLAVIIAVHGVAVLVLMYLWLI